MRSQVPFGEKLIGSDEFRELYAMSVEFEHGQKKTLGICDLELLRYGSTGKGSQLRTGVLSLGIQSSNLHCLPAGDFVRRVQ